MKIAKQKKLFNQISASLSTTQNRISSDQVFLQQGNIDVEKTLVNLRCHQYANEIDKVTQQNENMKIHTIDDFKNSPIEHLLFLEETKAELSRFIQQQTEFETFIGEQISQEQKRLVREQEIHQYLQETKQLLQNEEAHVWASNFSFSGRDLTVEKQKVSAILVDLLQFADVHFPLPDDCPPRILSLKGLLNELIEQKFSPISDGYLDTKQFICWQPHIELLLKTFVCEPHPQDSTQIRLSSLSY
eukprot:TRINITY_DN4599_c0_g1_i1.p1 TRINITY_DN4599_c0_g1~~TRINITY_DN4599_c0_g1_i1.p1  ORF type:complete len:245 (-),score=40.50 TRINITY_DN4599_c0_g1_i1:61-795(-)